VPVCALIGGICFVSSASAAQLQLYKTGVDNNGNVLGYGVSDPHWQLETVLNSDSGEAHNQPGPFPRAPVTINPSDVSTLDGTGSWNNSIAGSRWIWPGRRDTSSAGAPNPSDPFCGWGESYDNVISCALKYGIGAWDRNQKPHYFPKFVFTQYVDVDCSIYKDLSSLRLTMNVMADNFAKVYVNGQENKFKTGNLNMDWGVSGWWTNPEQVTIGFSEGNVVNNVFQCGSNKVSIHVYDSVWYTGLDVTGFFEVVNPQLRGASTINGQTNTVTVDPGDTVTFGHSIFKGNTTPSGDGEYYISESRLTDTGVTSTPYQGTHIGFNNGSWDNTNLPLQSGYSSNQFTVPSNAVEGDEWCQQVTFKAANSENAKNFISSNRVCVRVAKQLVAEETCQEFFGLKYSTFYGETAGMSIVRNDTANYNLWRTTVKDPHDNVNTIGKIFAKPNDYIQFRHTLCPGAQGVRYGTGRSTPVVSQNLCTIVADPNTYIYGTAVAGNNFNCARPLGDVTMRDFYDGSTPSRSKIFNADVGKTITQSMNYGSLAATSNHIGDNYTMGSVDNGTRTTSAAVQVPYNYTADPKLETSNSAPGVVFPGEDIAISATIDVDPRGNSPVWNTDYATKTKPSVYEVVTFIANVNSDRPHKYGDADNSTGGTFYGTTPGSGSTCNYYTSGMSLARGCQVYQREENQVFNDDANPLNGLTHGLLWSGTFNVDDYPIGTKLCVAVSVWPADSHNDLAVSTGADDDPSMDIDSGGYWQHAPPKCFDIAKKPNLQVWSSGIFSQSNGSAAGAGRIIASQSNKLIGGDYHTYGSWAEYAVVSNSPIFGFGSGAAFGYNASGPDVSNGGNLSAGLPGGLPTGATGPSSCQYSKTTIANVDCNNLGEAQIATGGISLTAARLLARYASAPKTGELPSSNFALGDLDLAKAINKYTATGDITIGGGTLSAGKTLIIASPGTVTISGNIQYYDGPYTSIEELPQLLIFSGDIKIAEPVTNLDSWLIVGKQSTGSGRVYTCGDYQVAINLGGDNCTHQLTINGPIFAKSIISNRTAGAGQGNASINPGEVFNLRPDTYLWALNQARNFHQAITTFQRNLPPRY
jgi:hypothetical protein